jgi:A/G-specific adenine glycosylase
VIGGASLRRWYEPRRRAYPWRETRDPYRVMVSEVMLQQTQASRVVAPYRAFIRRFPSVRALAQASRAEVVRAWGGLGYNRRAVALHEAAQMIVREHRGRVPSTIEALRRLPGVGAYTAAAVGSIAFGLPVPALDTNVARVVGRFVLGRDGAARGDVEAAAAKLVERRDPGRWNQAVMDLGREVCRPVPRCGGCPLARGCMFRRSGTVPPPATPTAARFEGSTRQLRGAIVRHLRAVDRATVAQLAESTGRPASEVAAAVRGLRRDGLVHAPPRPPHGRTVVRL